MFRKSKKADFLTKFQNFLNNQIPEVILSILRKTGYDTVLSIDSLTFEEIEKLEVYIRGRNDLVEWLKSTTEYKDQHPFAFLPGHRVLLVGLKKKTAAFELTLLHGSTRSNPLQTESREQTEESDNDHTNDTVKCKTILEKLNKKVENFLKRQNIDCDEDISNGHLPAALAAALDVSELEKTQNNSGKIVYKCIVKCVVCSVRTPCTFSGHWQISNYEAHLKRHRRIETPNLNVTESRSEITNHTSNPSVQNSETREATKRMSMNAQRQIDNILNINGLQINSPQETLNDDLDSS